MQIKIKKKRKKVIKNDTIIYKRHQASQSITITIMLNLNKKIGHTKFFKFHHFFFII